MEIVLYGDNRYETMSSCSDELTCGLYVWDDDGSCIIDSNDGCSCDTYTSG